MQGWRLPVRRRAHWNGEKDSNLHQRHSKCRVLPLDHPRTIGAPEGFRSPYCCSTDSYDSQFTTGAWPRQKESNLHPPPSHGGALIRWAMASRWQAGQGLNPRRLFWRQACYRYTTDLYWSRRLDSNQRSPHSRCGMLAGLHHTSIVPDRARADEEHAPGGEMRPCRRAPTRDG